MIYAENILLCIAAPLLLSLLFVRGQAKQYVLAFAAGMVACLLAAYVTGFLRLLIAWEETDVRIFLSPVVEELVKLLPLLILLLLAEPGDDTLLLLAVALGTGFATFENCCSLLGSGEIGLSFVLIRGLAVGVMHIVSVAALSLGIIAARRLQALSLPALVGAFSLSVVFHGLYNLLVSVPGVPSYVGFCLPVLAAAGIYHPLRRLYARENQSPSRQQATEDGASGTPPPTTDFRL